LGTLEDSKLFDTDIIVSVCTHFLNMGDIILVDDDIIMLLS